jgi:hypothetical protein
MLLIPNKNYMKIRELARVARLPQKHNWSKESASCSARYNYEQKFNGGAPVK